MEVIISSLIFAAMVTADSIGMHRVLDPLELESKIYKGDHVEEGEVEYEYIASLQLNGRHICTSGFIHEHLLLSTGGCVWHIENGIESMREATAVVGDVDLRKGKRIRISEVAYHSRFVMDRLNHMDNSCDMGVVRLTHDAILSRLPLLKLNPDIIDLRIEKNDGLVCGWGADATEDKKNNDILKAPYAYNLRCMMVNLYSAKNCSVAIRPGDYRRYMLCGQGEDPQQSIDLGDLGSPLFKSIKDVATNQTSTYIIGITVRRYPTEGETYLRFIRTSRAAYKEISRMTRELTFRDEENSKCDNSSGTDSVAETNKRRKLQ